MAYQVIKAFADLKDGNYLYKVGETYPRDGQEPTEERIAELAGNKNRQKHPLISLVEEPEPQKEAEEPAAEAEEPAGENAAAEAEEPVAEVTAAEPTKTTGKGKKTKES